MIVTVTVATVVDLGADLAAGPLGAVDVDVRQAGVERVEELLVCPHLGCPDRVGPITSPGRIVPVMVAGGAGHTCVPGGSVRDRRVVRAEPHADATRRTRLVAEVDVCLRDVALEPAR